MKKQISFLLIFCLGWVTNARSQTCSGSLGDPVFAQRFPSTGALPTGQTTYTYVNNRCPSDGFYSVLPSTTGCFGNSWHTVSDRSPGGGTNFMIVNAANTAGEFFRQNVTGLCSNTQYEFSAWVINLLRTTACTSNPNRFPNLTFRIETTAGVLVRSFSTGQITSSGTWEKKATSFVSPSSSLVVRIINNAPGGCGNDLALDDIEFRPCGGTTYAAITSGAGNVCVNSSVSITGSTSGFTNPVYQWQISTNQTTWTNISGATNTVLTTTNATAGTFFYRLLAAESGNIGNTNCRIASNPVSVTFNAFPPAPTASSVEYCQNSTAAPLTATGQNLRWYTSASGGSASATAPIPATTAVGSTIYYVSQTTNGCESPLTAVTVNVNPLPVLLLTAEDVKCNMGTSGSIKAESSGGTPAYEYSLDGGVFQTGNVFANLSAGSHTVVLRDSKGCTNSKTVTIAQPNPISLTTEVSNNCSTPNNGVIVASGAGGIGTLIYALDGGTYGSANTFSELPAGDHTISVRDANGCTITSLVTVPVIAPLSVSASGLTCVVGNTGSITLTGSGGRASYTYSLDGGAFQNSGSFTSLAPGTYASLTAKDARGCTATTSFSVTAKPAPPGVTTPVKYCQNATAQALTALGQNLLWYTEASGGTGSNSAPVPSTASAGSTNFYVSQTVNGCESERAIITVEVSSAFTLSLASQDACAGSGGRISASVSGGSSPFTYALNAGVAGGDNVFSNVVPGTFTVTATDANGCTQEQQVTIVDKPKPTVTASAPTTCVAVGAGQINATGAGGTPGYEFKLNAGDYQTANSFTGLNPGDFTLTVKDANGCTNTDEIKLTSSQATATTNAPTCGKSIIELYGSAESNTATFSWSGPDGFSSTAQNPQIAYTSAAQNGTYTLTITDGTCIATTTVDVQCDANVPFPVTVVSFAAQQVENHVRVNWYTTEQILFKGFDLERSRDGKRFTKIAYLPADELKNSEKYSYDDTQPMNGINYYRLKQLDVDGTTTYSRIVAVNYIKDSEYAAVVNPCEGNRITVYSNIAEPTVKIVDIQGSQVSSFTLKTPDGFEVVLPSSAHHTSYLVHITGKHRVFMQKVIKL